MRDLYDTAGHECHGCGALPGERCACEEHVSSLAPAPAPEEVPCRYCGWPVQDFSGACASCAHLDIVRTVERFDRIRGRL